MARASRSIVRAGLVAVLIAMPVTGGIAAQEAGGERQAPPPDTADAPRQESPRREEPAAGEERPVFLFGPRFAPPPDALLPPADRPPTPLLVGPYLPEGSISLPATSDLAGQESESGEPADEPPADDIAVAPLKTLDPAAIGIRMDETASAVPVNVWDGTSRARLAAMLPALDLAIPSPAARSLARRLLLAPARIPDAEEGEEGADILALRLERLAAGGEVDDLLALAAEVPPEEMTEEIERLRTDAWLVSGELDSACSLARTAVRRSGAVGWLRILAMCEALDGNRAGAFFRLNLIEEAGAAEPALSALIEALLGADGVAVPTPGGEPLERATHLDPLFFALARLTEARIPARLVETAGPTVLALLIESPGLDEAAHRAAIERGLDAGLVAGDALAAFYAAVPFGREDMERVFDYMAAEQEGGAPDIETPAGLALDALLFQRVLAADTPQEKARWIEIALERADDRGLVRETAQALAGPLAAVSAVPELAAFADTAGLIHLVAGDMESALAWYGAARAAARAGDGAATDAVIALWPFLVVADATGAVPYSDRLAELWWQSLEPLAAAERQALGDLLFSLFREFGRPVPERLERQVLAGPHSRGGAPPVALWRSLIVATMRQYTGEAALAALAGLGDGGPAASDPSFLVTAVGALTRLGFGEEARRLALEAVAAEGFRRAR